MAWRVVLLVAEHPSNVQLLRATIPPKSPLATALQFVSVLPKPASMPVPALFSAEQSRRIETCAAEIPATALSCARQPTIARFSPATNPVPAAVQAEALRCKNAPPRGSLL